ncbi:glycerophosphodiester phosphodiesterase [Peribacillus saganii]|nr:glycerophosphodiester phosphodiesterase family protein [Peribacillus saganii]
MAFILVIVAVAIFLSVLILLFRNQAPAYEVPLRRKQAVLKIGHRGASGYRPENTLSSFKKAIELKVDFIELDIQLSKDGQIVVFHDPTVDRTTNGKGEIRDYTYEELFLLDAGSWFHPNFSNEYIPLLSEVLDISLPDTGLIIELKNPHLSPGIELKLADELLKRKWDSEKFAGILVQSFDKETIKRFHALLPEIPIGIIVRYNPKGISDSFLNEVSSYAAFVNPKRSMITPNLIERIHSKGMKVFTWTVNDKKQVAKLLSYDLDGITTDYPDLF